MCIKKFENIHAARLITNQCPFTGIKLPEYPGSGDLKGGGGLIDNEGNLEIADAVFDFNTTKYGGAILNNEGNSSINNVILVKNKADYGGAIENFGNETRGY
jgi:hypothetical protein